MDDRRRQRPDEVEGAARHHQHPGGAAALVEDVLERLEALLGAGRVERGQALVPGRHHDRRQLLVAPALRLVRRRHQPEPERWYAGRRHDVDGRVEDDVGHLRRLGGDLRTEEEELGQQRRGRAPLELLAHVRGVRRRRADREPSRIRAKPSAGSSRPSPGRSVARRALAPVRRPRPGDEFGAGRLDVGSQYRVGEHAQAVPALDQRARDAHQRRRRAGAVPGGHQQVGHLEPPPG